VARIVAATAIQRSCWRSSSRARRNRTVSAQAAAARPTVVPMSPARPTAAGTGGGVTAGPLGGASASATTSVIRALNGRPCHAPPGTDTAGACASQALVAAEAVLSTEEDAVEMDVRDVERRAVTQGLEQRWYSNC
jgi:hypothetical protein